MTFDLDAVLAEEAEQPPFTFTFDRHKYSLPATPDVRAIAAITAGRLDEGLRLLLNPDQWQRIQDSPKVLTATALGKVFDAYIEYGDGLTVGESAASTRSSKSTARPAKRTSKGSTGSASRR